jgi:hypothetical protein
VHRRADLAKPQKRQPKKASTASGPKIEIATAAPPPEANEAVKPRRRHRRQSPPVSGSGLTYNVSNNLIDFSWRYLNLGSPQTAIVQCQNTPACPSAFYTLKDMTSQDFRIGFRWMIQPAAGIGVMAAQPVFAPQPEYEPPPVYAPQAPLSSRG